MSRRRWSLLQSLLIVAAILATAALNPSRLLAQLTSPGAPRSSQAFALVLLSGADSDRFGRAVALARRHGAEVTLAYAPDAFIGALPPAAESALKQQSLVARAERGAVDPATLRALGDRARVAARVWNTVYQGLADPSRSSAPPAEPGRPSGPDFDIPDDVHTGRSAPGDHGGAPSTNQTSEYMAGTAVASVIFVESSGGAGNCAPADDQTEDWDEARRSTVLAKIGEGFTFWTARQDRPSQLTFLVDDLGVQSTSCEPIVRSSLDEGLWTADVLSGLGYAATPTNTLATARSLANARRAALGADWGFVIYVVDSRNDVDGVFADGRFAYASLNGPRVVLTYDNENWDVARMHLVVAHETGHIFGALDEYEESGCVPEDSWGYLNALNASCNNGGLTTDFSIMGPAVEQQSSHLDVSASAREAIGWRNPGPGADGQTVVDVVRTSTVDLTPHRADPTSDATPTFSAAAGNTPFPPGGCNLHRGACVRTPAPVSIARVTGAEGSLDGGDWTASGVLPTDGEFGGKSEAYTFTPGAPLADGPHTIGTRAINSFGHVSSLASDSLTVNTTAADPLPTSVPTFGATDVDLAVSVSGPTAPVAPKARVTYTFTVRNDGPAPATNVRLSSPLPVRARFLAGSSSTGCALVGKKRPITCSLGGLASGASRTVRLVLVPSRIGTLSVSGAVQADQQDPVDTNNSTVAEATVRKPDRTSKSR